MLKNLYEIKNTNHLLFLKRTILSIKMEENESVATFISRIKDLKNKLGDIGKIMSNTNLVMITMNGWLATIRCSSLGWMREKKPPSLKN